MSYQLPSAKMNYLWSKKN